MSTLGTLDLVRKQIIFHKMLSPGEKVLAACSGGCDSMAMTHILSRLQEEMGFQLAAANIDHMLRPEAKEEAALVEQFCSFLKIPYYYEAIDVPCFAKKSGLSMQEAARHKRFEFLRHTARKLGGAKIATGHHRDDQAETVLLHLLRGSGSGGLGGMKPCASGIIRPLLSLSRSELENYCAENNIPFCHDMSNFKTDYLRNAVRLNLIPQLAREYNNNIGEALAKTAEIVAAENDFISISAHRVWENTVTNGETKTLRLNIARFNQLHLAVKRELIRQIIEKKMGKLTGISFVHVESLIKLAMDGRVGSITTLPHALIVEKTYDSLIFAKKSDELECKDLDQNLFPTPQVLTIDGLTPISTLGLTIASQLHSSCPNAPAGDAAVWTAVFDYERLAPPFFIRTRLPGDRFTPNGAAGGKKLKDFFIDKKVPQKVRDFVPLIFDQKGIIWVAGYRRANRGQITAATKIFLQLTVIKQKGTRI